MASHSLSNLAVSKLVWHFRSVDVALFMFIYPPKIMIFFQIGILTFKFICIRKKMYTYVYLHIYMLYIYELIEELYMYIHWSSWPMLFSEAWAMRPCPGRTLAAWRPAGSSASARPSASRKARRNRSSPRRCRRRRKRRGKDGVGTWKWSLWWTGVFWQTDWNSEATFRGCWLNWKASMNNGGPPANMTFTWKESTCRMPIFLAKQL